MAFVAMNQRWKWLVAQTAFHQGVSQGLVQFQEAGLPAGADVADVGSRWGRSRAQTGDESGDVVHMAEIAGGASITENLRRLSG